MDFTHYYPRLLVFTERLLNSYDVMRPEPEALHTAADLNVLMEDVPLAGARADLPDVTEIRQIRQQLRQLFQLTGGAALEHALNQALQDVPTRVKVFSPTGQGLLVLPAESQASRRWYAACLISLAWALEQYGPERFRTCQAMPCQDVFVDTSKNGQRRFCGPRCANRAHSRAFRQREGSA